MKLIEIFADKILNLPLMEMAMQRADAIKHIKSFERKLNEHLIKYFYFEDNAKNHWLKEIMAFISEINDVYLKSKGKKIDAKIYYEKLFEDFFGHGTNVIQNRLDYLTIGNYNNTKTTDLSIEQVHWCLKHFYRWLCPLLAKDQYLSMMKQNRNTLQEKLDELILKAKEL